MTIKELKALFEGCDEDTNVCIDDADGRTIRICGGGERSDCGIVLSVHQEFPEEWFDKNGNEVRWVRGKRVELDFKEMDDELICDCGEFGGVDIKLHLNDGWATGKGVLLNYPRLEDLTDEQISEIDIITGYRVSETGFLCFSDVAIAYGKVVKYNPPVKRLDRDSALICESIQEVTLTAWPMVYGKNNDYDLDSLEILDLFRTWGEEFESWWINHDEDWICSHDYISEVEHFAEQKAAAYIESLK